MEASVVCNLLFQNLLGEPFTDLCVDALDHGAEAAAPVIVPALIDVIAVEPISTEEKRFAKFVLPKSKALKLIHPIKIISKI